MIEVGACGIKALQPGHTEATRSTLNHTRHVALDNELHATYIRHATHFASEQITYQRAHQTGHKGCQLGPDDRLPECPEIPSYRAIVTGPPPLHRPCRAGYLQRGRSSQSSQFSQAPHHTQILPGVIRQMRATAPHDARRHWRSAVHILWPAIRAVCANPGPQRFATLGVLVG